MPTFSTPTPIDVALNVRVGAVEVIASDRTDTVVTVTPTSDKSTDARGAADTTVTLEGDRLTITTPKPRFSIVGPTESIDVRVEVPTGSRLTAEVGVGNLRSTGTLGATRVKGGLGTVTLDATGDAWVRANHGNATVGAADGDIDVTADHGQIRIGTVTGGATLKASHGSITIDEAGGEVEAKLSYGDLEITTARSDVAAKTAYGSIQLREVSAGAIDIESGYGGLSVGIATGVAAWLDLASKNGRVRNQLDSDSAAAASEKSVTVRARTQFGDIDVERAK